jgi:iron complex outermembrane receptor protein
MNDSLVSRLTPLAAALALIAPMLAQAQQVQTPPQTQSPPQQSPAAAAPPAAALHDVVVTGNPLGSDLVDMVPPTSTLDGDDLAVRRGSTLGDTLDRTPGVAQSQYGPNVSRPIIRGMDGDRIRILSNGGTSLDASALSNDHAVPIDPLSADRIEVIRGPAALMYGGSALGGVVNVISNVIPKDPIQGVDGSVEVRGGGAADERAGSAMVEAGDSEVAIHAEGFYRDTSDLRIPGYARSARLRALGAPPDGDVEGYGRLPNSSSHESGGAMGLSRTWDTGYAGFSYNGYDSDYGTVAEQNTRIRMHQDRVAFEGEQRDMGGFITRITSKINYSDYVHREISDGQVGTTFRNHGWDGRLEAHHAALGPLTGVFGVEIGQHDFSALGDEAFVPSTSSETAALFVYEEMPLVESGRLRLNFGGRLEHDTVDASAGGSDRFFDASRSFTPGSLSTGLLYKLTPAYTLTSSLAYTQRAPTFYELFANGPHGATGTYELGDPNAQMEKATSLDLGLRFKRDDTSANLSAYYSQFSNFLALAASGQSRDESGAVVAPGTDGALPEFRYLGVPAKMYGLEAQGRTKIAKQMLAPADSLSVEVRADVVRGTNRDTGEPLPRLAPWRAGTSLIYDNGPWNARANVDFVAAQHQVPINDTPTAGYALLGFSVNYSFRWSGTRTLVYLRGDNLTNQEARNATSVLRDVAPLGGRAVTVGLRSTF